MRWAILAGALLLACGGEDPIDCNVNDRGGTYLVQYRERPNGTCGPIPDTVVSEASATLMGITCTVVSEDISSDQCDIDRTLTCNDSANGVSFTMVGSSTQVNDDASRLEGIVTITLRDNSSGQTVCTGTYDVTWTRE